MPRMRSRNRRRETADLNITAFLNLMVILVPFLLITAVFSRMAILELNLPAAAAEQRSEERFRLEVVVREDRLDVGDGRGNLIERFRRGPEGYPIDALSTLVQAIKTNNEGVVEASILMEPQIPYDVLIQLMDAVRAVEVPDPENPGGTMQAELFPAISIGDAP